MLTLLSSRPFRSCCSPLILATPLAEQPSVHSSARPVPTFHEAHGVLEWIASASTPVATRRPSALLVGQLAGRLPYARGARPFASGRGGPWRTVPPSPRQVRCLQKGVRRVRVCMPGFPLGCGIWSRLHQAQCAFQRRAMPTSTACESVASWGSPEGSPHGVCSAMFFVWQLVVFNYPSFVHFIKNRRVSRNNPDAPDLSEQVQQVSEPPAQSPDPDLAPLGDRLTGGPI